MLSGTSPEADLELTQKEGVLMETLIHRLAQVLAVVGVVSLLIGMIDKLFEPGALWMAYPSGWFLFATTCGILAIAGPICWPLKEGAQTE